MIALALMGGTGALLARRFAAEASRTGLVGPRRHALLASAVATATVLVVMTEVLGAAGVLTRGGITLGWAVAAAGALVVARRSPAVLAAPVRRDPVVVATAAVITLVAATTAVIAWAAPPNTWDSMTYHMARVVQWESRASVAHYPTHITRQILYTPGAELALLHLQLAWGGDRLANFLQWGAFVGVVAGASLVAARLGATARGEALAALFCATAPLAILESSSTQNDLIGAFWLLAVAYCALLWRQRPSTAAALGVGASLGLALLAKITAYVLVLPWIAAFALGGLRAGRSGRRAVTAALAVALALNAGHYARHLALWWSISRGDAPIAAAAPSVPTGAGTAERLLRSARAHAPDTAGTTRYLNAVMSPAFLASNVVRNVALHVALPSDAGAALVERLVVAAHEALGVDPTDPRTTYPRGRTFRAPRLERHEDVAPNPLHLTLVVAALALLALGRRRSDTGRHAAFVATAFVLFCLVFKWQPWHTRLHLPLFVLAAPAVAVALTERLPRGAVVALGAVLLAASVPWIVANRSRPLLGPASVLVVPRAEQYFANRPHLYAPYARAIARLRTLGCRDLGLVIGGNDWEYPLWAMLPRGGAPLRIEHVRVTNESRFAAGRGDDHAPCAVVGVGVPRMDAMPVGDRTFRPAFVDGPLQVLTP